MPQQFYIKDTNEAVIVDDKPFAGGGEGGLFNIQSPVRFANYVAKIFHAHKRKDQHREAKINYLLNNRPNFEYNPNHQPIVWVEKSLYDDKGAFVGFIMPKATGEKLEILCSPKLPKRLGSEWDRLAFGHEDALKLRMKVCYNIAAAIHQIHETGKYVLVDLKPDNILIHSNGLVSIVDMDSIEVMENGKTIFPATVVTPEYTPPEYYEGIRPGDVLIEKSWDQFSMAVIFYRLLLGIHPFAASAVPPFDNLVSLGDKIHHGLYVHQPNRKGIFSVIPPPHQRFMMLDEEIQALFNKTFVDGHKDAQNRIGAEYWGTSFLNSPLLLIDRPLPTKVLNVGNPLSQNWYEVAVGKAIQELKLAAPVPDNAQQALNVKNNSLVGETLGFYKNIGKALLNLAKFGGIVVAVIIGFVFFIGLFSDDFKLDTALEVVGQLLMIVPRTLGWLFYNPFILLLVLIPIALTVGRKGFQFIGKKIGDVFENMQENLAVNKKVRRKQLEDKQYSLFTKRVKLKQRLQEIKTELNILDQVKSKKENNFQRTYGQKVKSTNQQIQSDLTKEAYQLQQKDQKARDLMRQEALEVRDLRTEFMDTLLNAAPYAEIIGNSPEQKIANLEQWKSQQNGAPDEIEQKAAKLKTELEQLRAELDQKIQEIRERYDLLHQTLIDEGQEYKIKIEDIIESASEKIRIESKLDSQLLDKSYKKLLKTRNELLVELYGEEDKLNEMNVKIKDIRDELNQLR